MGGMIKKLNKLVAKQNSTQARLDIQRLEEEISQHKESNMNMRMEIMHLEKDHAHEMVEIKHRQRELESEIEVHKARIEELENAIPSNHAETQTEIKLYLESFAQTTIKFYEERGDQIEAEIANSGTQVELLMVDSGVQNTVHMENSVAQTFT